MGTVKTLITLVAQADPSLRWMHRSFCLFCHAAAQLYEKLNPLLLIGLTPVEALSIISGLLICDLVEQ